MARPIDDVKNWMNMFRWIVKLIRDDYGIDEAILTRQAVLEKDIGLGMEQIEAILDEIAESFTIRFPDGTLDEIVSLEELCMLASWIKGYYKQPAFISESFASLCQETNQGMG